MDDHREETPGPARRWPALVLEAARVDDEALVSAILDDFAPAAIEDLLMPPVPPGGLWDPTFDPPPEPPPAPLHWRVFFHTSEARAAAAAALRDRVSDLIIEPVEISDDNWAARSQQSLTAIRAGAFVVAPPWDTPATVDAGTTVIIIEPSRGFGTGHHESTRLCLRALSDLDIAGARVLDLGTGSGVLGMAAALKGAGEVVAVDVDGDAIEAAKESAALNDLPIAIAFVVADFRTASARALREGRYDVVLANLTGGMLRSSADQVAALVAPGGRLVTSGFDDHERDGVRDAFAAFERLASLGEQGWACLVLAAPETAAASKIAPERP